MGKFGIFLAASTIAAALLAYRCKIAVDDVQPETMADHVWWGPANTTADRDAAALRPFRINVSAEVIEDLKNRLRNVRPRTTRPLENANFEYGFNGDHLAEVVEHWSRRYDWPARQAYLNSLPQFKTNIDGLDVHFVRAACAARRCVPLLVLHGWPGSVVEFYKIVPMLTEGRRRADATDDRGDGGDDDDDDFAFEVIAPSLPGYGFSDAPARPGMGPAHVGQLFVKLMARLGHDKFYVQGGDWGAVISEAIAKLFPDRVYGMHSNMCSTIQALDLCYLTRLALGTFWPSLVVSTEREKSITYPLADLFTWFLEESGYMHLQMTKPDTIGVGLNDSPAGLAAYILEKFATWTNSDNKHLADGGLSSKYDTDELLDNVMIYWITGSITTSMRLYSEFATKKYQALPHIKAKIKVPVACAMFPNEMPAILALKKLLHHKYVNLVRATEMADGGHFAAFEQPRLLADDIRSSVREMETIRKRV